MLVTFRTRNYPDTTMFGDVALRLLRLMGHSGTVPSAIRAEDVPQALHQLKAALSTHEDPVAEPDDDAVYDDEESQEAVGLKHRAVPLIGLLESAVRSKSDVMWDT